MNENLVNKNLNLVYVIVKQMRGMFGAQFEFNDLVSYGVIGLIDAAKRFDPDKDCKFTTYASFRVRGAIVDGVRDEMWITRGIIRFRNKLNKARHALFTQLNEVPTALDICDYLDISLDRYNELNKRTAPTSEDTTYPLQSGDDPFYYVLRKDTLDQLLDLIERMDCRIGMILEFYYFEELSLKEIAQIFGVSVPMIGQLKTEGISELRDLVEF